MSAAYGDKPDTRHWTDNGACKGKSSEDWFPPHDRASTYWLGTARALSVCRTCPVVVECREYALEHEPYGTWGGMTYEQRDLWRRENGLPTLYGGRRFGRFSKRSTGRLGVTVDES